MLKIKTSHSLCKKKNTDHLRVDSPSQVIFGPFHYMSVWLVLPSHNKWIVGGKYHFIFPQWFLIFSGANKMKLEAAMCWFLFYLASVGSVQKCRPQHWSVIFFCLLVICCYVLTLSCVLVPWNSTEGVSNAECKTGHACVL